MFLLYYDIHTLFPVVHISGYNFEYGGDAGVTFFFVLSGFVISCGYGDRVCGSYFKWSSFMRKRIVKLYPLHLLTFFVALLMGFVVGIKFSAVKTVLHMLMLQEFTLSANLLNYGTGLSWFLGALIFCYALFPMLYKCIMFYSRWCIGGIAVLYFILYVTIVAHCNNSAIDNYVYAFPPFRIIDFFIGIIVFRLYSLSASTNIMRRISLLPHSVLTVCDVLVVVLCISTWLVYPSMPSWFRFSMLFWVPFGLLIYWFAVSDGSSRCLQRVMRCRVLVALGGISFEIYMIHGIIITLCVFGWGCIFGYDTVPNGVHFAFCFAVSVVMAKLYSVATIKMREVSLHK